MLKIITNKKVLLSMGTIAFVAALYAGGTGAFFSSQATNTGNVFQAGTLDLELAHDENGNYEKTKAAAWTFNNMVPGGTPVEDSIWLQNTGSIDGMSLGVAMDNAIATVANTAKQMRITKMSLGGVSLLQGGAGATLEEYVAPTQCDINVGSDPNYTIIDAIADGNTTAGEVICVSGSDYNSTWEGANQITVNKSVTIVTLGGPSATKSVPFLVTADNVTIRGFEITNPLGSYGVQVSGVDGAQVLDNYIHDIGSDASVTGSAQAVYLVGSTGVTGFTVKGNTISNVGHNALVKGAGSGSSAKGVYIGDSTGANSITGVVIENNVISDIEASTLPFNGNTGGRGAYGIMTNYGASNVGTTGLVVKNNTITDLEGLWSHAVGLEGPTPSASVTLNDISNVVDHKGNTDAVGVMIESNPNYASVTINQNNFAPNVPLGIRNTMGGAVNGQNNWWGDINPAGKYSGSVNTNGAAGNPFAGLVNGNDANGNGFADLQDLNTDPILNAGVGLDASEKKLFEMAVQLDGPTTGNEFQGASLTTDFVFTLNQI